MEVVVSVRKDSAGWFVVRLDLDWVFQTRDRTEAYQLATRMFMALRKAMLMSDDMAVSLLYHGPKVAEGSER